MYFVHLESFYPATSRNLILATVTPSDLTAVLDFSETKEKATFWRAYTTALLFQNPKVQSQLKMVDPQVMDLISSFSHVQSEPVSISDSNLGTLRKWLHSVMILAAELKCQRFVYEVDESVQLGDLYDDTKMLDMKFVVDEENASYAFVDAIISRGVVKRSYAGDKEVRAQIGKTKVLVKIERVEEQMEDVRVEEERMGDGRVEKEQTGDGQVSVEQMGDGQVQVGIEQMGKGQTEAEQAEMKRMGDGRMEGQRGDEWIDEDMDDVD
jgi:hypothetical protein